ncbi:hypothetical protein JCGZ_02621 [Jatropha curcas]|uniref:Uncharacterized protein n=1 Tax=Jatropha curcas TaxID=180498 RepID=A0A067KTQ0_JATCU|nr:putative disease resistance protein RGA3 [Jatropha curcas]KDP39601.1 hypothetical protein JCGZ_02621 [Jatropha curcas]
MESQQNPLEAAKTVIDPVVGELINLATSLIKDEYHLVQGVKEEVIKLSSNLTAIEAVLKIAEEKRLEETHLRDWLRKLKNAVWDAEDVLDTFRTNASLLKRKQEVRCFKPPLSLSKTSYKYDAAHKIKEISSKLELIAEERKKFHLDINFDGERPRMEEPTSSFPETACVFGRDDDKKRLVDLLLSDDYERVRNTSLIPIIGMGGLGKTTLARLLYNDRSVEKHFEFRMWVRVSVPFNLTSILREMMESYLEMPLAVDLSSSLVQSRFREFLPGKRFLLVLDDVWSVDYNKDWSPLLQLLEMGEKGSKVLVTTRNHKVAKIVDSRFSLLLECLPENESWSLFKNRAFRSGNLSSSVLKDLEDIGKGIVRNCGGLPLAVKAMGDHLQGIVEVSRWRKVMNKSINELEESINILPTLKLSYDYLPSHLKRCFEFCSIFPKSYDFDKEELVKLWMAQCFIQSHGIDRAEKIGIEYFDELLARSFFQVSTIHGKVQYRMHDLVHDLAQSVSSTYCCQVKDIKLCSFSKGYRHISLLSQDIEQSALKIVDSSIKLRTLLLPGDHVKDLGQAFGKIFDGLKYIRVLDLSSSVLLQLPKSIEKLKLLRYLDLSETDIKVLPDSICNLYNLQTLKMLGCPWLFSLPKDLGKLVNLHYLQLDEMFWFKCEALPPYIGKLINLHNLSAFRVGSKTGYGIEELKEMAYLQGTLHISTLENAVNAKEAKLSEKESLQKLVFEWSNRVINPRDEAAEERILEDLLPHSNIKELQICNYKSVGLPSWMRDGLLQNLVTLTLNHCTKTKILTLGQLPCLEALNIKGLQELEEWPNLQLPTLHRLKICDCPKLIRLPDISHKLGILKIKRCKSLNVLPVTPCLECLMVVDNPSLKDWNEVTVPLESKEEKSSLPTLAKLKMVNCPKISALPQVFSPTKLEITMCESLTTISSTEHMQHLQHLALDTCSYETLVGILPYASSLSSLIISNLENLVSFPKWPHLPELKALYIHCSKELVSLSQKESLRSLKSLKLLSIKDCPKLVSLPDEGLPVSLECLSINSCAIMDSLGPKEILKNLTSLKDLHIQDCPLIHSFPEDGLPASLQHLHIQNCPLITERCQKENGAGPEWPKIMNIPDLEID